MIAQEIVQRVKWVAGAGGAHLQRPQLTKFDRQAASGGLFGLDWIGPFERLVAAQTPGAHALATSSGTAALHLALLMAGVKPRSKVIVPALTFAASANAVRYCEADPVFVDVDPETFLIKAEGLAEYVGERADVSGQWPAAIMAVHLMGRCADVSAIKRAMSFLADWLSIREIPIAEDAAQAFGALQGVSGHAAAYSFNLNKIVTTGGGGALVSNDADVVARARHLAQQAKVDLSWEHDAVGYNYRVNPLGAALGCGQIERLQQTIEAKRKLSESYVDAFADMPEVRVVAGGNHWLNVLMVPEQDLDRVVYALRVAGIACRRMFKPLHLTEAYKDAPRMDDLSGAESVWRRALCLPSTVMP